MKKLLEYWEVLVSVGCGIAVFSSLSVRVTATEMRQLEDRETIKEMARDVRDTREDVSYIRGKFEK